MASLINKSRRPKFELHLKIFDLNNIPLVSGSSFIKWHLTHSMHAEHRGRTNKCAIADHKVEYGFCKLVQGVRMHIDKSNNLTECPIEFEVLQEFNVTDKISLGRVKLNLSEYVEECEALSREIGSPPRKRSSIGVTSGESGDNAETPVVVEDGIVCRYLMQESKVNSTVKIGIFMVQVDGERNFVAPALRTAPVFGGIAGLVAPDEEEDETGQTPSFIKPRDATEVHDLYRRTLAASWSRQPNELPADETIEDIFSGGNGWKTKKETPSNHDTEDDESEMYGTLRPSDFRRFAAHRHHQRSQSGTNDSGRTSAQPTSHHRRTHSASSDRSASTVTGGGGPRTPRRDRRLQHEDSRGSRDEDDGSSLGSLAPTLGSSSDGGHNGEQRMKRAREVEEFEAREDLVAWKLPGGTVAA